MKGVVLVRFDLWAGGGALGLGEWARDAGPVWGYEPWFADGVV